MPNRCGSARPARHCCHASPATRNWSRGAMSGSRGCERPAVVRHRVAHRQCQARSAHPNFTPQFDGFSRFEIRAKPQRARRQPCAQQRAQEDSEMPAVADEPPYRRPRDIERLWIERTVRSTMAAAGAFRHRGGPRPAPRHIDVCERMHYETLDDLLAHRRRLASFSPAPYAPSDRQRSWSCRNTDASVCMRHDDLLDFSGR